MRFSVIVKKQNKKKKTNQKITHKNIVIINTTYGSTLCLIMLFHCVCMHIYVGACISLYITVFTFGNTHLRHYMSLWVHWNHQSNMSLTAKPKKSLRDNLSLHRNWAHLYQISHCLKHLHIAYWKVNHPYSV